ncbi:MAG: type II secretion system F family protein [Candidatus Hydrothermales bacterium]
MVNLILIILLVVGAVYIFVIFLEEFFILYLKSIQKKLDPADFPVKNFILLELRLIFAFSIVTYLFLGKTLATKLFVIFLFTILVIIFFPQYAYTIRNRWIEKFNDQLEEGMRLIVSGLKAGLGFNHCFRIVVQQMPPPMQTEFKRVLDEISLGLTLEEALRHLEDRIPSRELKIFTSAVILQRRTGGSLVDVLSGIAETIKARRRLKRRIDTLTAEGRLSATVLTLLPLFLLILLRITQPELFAPMLEEPLGIFMLFIAALLDIIAALWIRKIVTIEI